MSSDDPRFDESPHASDEPTEKGRPYYDMGWKRRDGDILVRCNGPEDYTEIHTSTSSVLGMMRCAMCWRDIPHSEREHDYQVTRSDRA